MLAHCVGVGGMIDSSKVERNSLNMAALLLLLLLLLPHFVFSLQTDEPEKNANNNRLQMIPPINETKNSR